jgi:hypothetical protein
MLEGLVGDLSEIKADQVRFGRRMDLFEMEQSKMMTWTRAYALKIDLVEADIFKMRLSFEEDFAKLEQGRARLEEEVAIIKDGLQVVKTMLRELK